MRHRVCGVTALLLGTSFAMVPLGCGDGEEAGSAASGGSSGSGGAPAGGSGGGGGTGGSSGVLGACFGPSVLSGGADVDPLLVLADVDCDGKLDAIGASVSITGEQIDGGLSIRLAKGDGTFGPSAELDLGMGPASMVTGDFDADGVTDLVVAGGVAYGHGRLVLLPGDCAEGFKAPIVIADPSQYLGTDMAAGDLDGDTSDDLVVSRWYPPYGVEVLLGGPAPLTQKVSSPAIDSKGWTLAVGDLDGDARLDVVVGSNSGTSETSSLHIMRNAGTGLLTKATPLPLEGGISGGGIRALDLDGDGAEEVVLQRGFSSLFDNQSFVDVFHVDPETGGLTAQNLSAEKLGALIETGDVDGDGDEDLAVSFLGAHTELVLSGSAGPLTADVPFAGASHSGAAHPLRVGDVDGDGRADLVFLHGKGSLEVFRSAAAECVHVPTTCGGSAALGESHYPLKIAPDLASSTRAVVLGDVTGDGSVDLVTMGEQAVAVMKNDGTGKFDSGPEVALQPTAIAVGRFGSTPKVVITDGSAGWTTLDSAGAVEHIQPAGFPKIGDVRAGDFDGDGSDDLALDADNQILILPKGSTAGLVQWAFQGYVGASLLAAVDFDDDGKTDLLVDPHVDSGGGPCILHGPISPATECVSAGKVWGTLDIGEFDGDPQPELLLTSVYSNVVLTSVGATPQPILQPSQGWFAARLMQRGASPALLIALKGGELRAFEGAGDGTLSSTTPIYVHQADGQLRWVDAEDVDGDGKDEVVGISTKPSPTVWVLKECD